MSKLNLFIWNLIYLIQLSLSWHKGWKSIFEFYSRLSISRRNGNENIFINFLKVLVTFLPRSENINLRKTFDLLDQKSEYGDEAAPATLECSVEFESIRMGSRFIDILVHIDFLTIFYNNNVSYSGINTARSALSCFLFSNTGISIGNYPLKDF